MNGLEAEIGKRQLAIKKANSQSWYHRVNKIANFYKLPNCYTIFNENPWDKKSWKTTIKNALHEYQINLWKSELSKLPSLAMLNPGFMEIGTPHPVWSTAGYSVHSVRQAISKVRFLTDTLMTGEKLAKMYGLKPTCNCGFPIENRFHILLDCETYRDLREHFIKKTIKIITDAHPWIITEHQIRDRTALCFLMIDPSWFRADIGSLGKGLPNIMKKEVTNEIEVIGRIYCYQIYRRRFSILSYNDDSDSETEDEDKFSLHDTSDESDTSSCSLDSNSTFS